MAALKVLLLLIVAISSSFVHTMPGRREDAHYTDGKHNEEYDHESFLGHEGQKEFGEMDNKERVQRLE